MLKCSAGAAAVLRHAATLAALSEGSEVTTPILLWALAARNGSARQILQEAGIGPESCGRYLKAMPVTKRKAPPGEYSAKARRILQLAQAYAAQEGEEEVHTQHLLLAILKEPRTCAYRMLRDLGADPGKMQTAILRHASGEMVSAEIERFSIDLTRAARNGQYDPVAAREKEIEAVFRILQDKERYSPILVGHPGVGKTAIAEEIARRIAADSQSLKRLVRLDTGALIAGTAQPGDFEKRFRDFLSEVQRHEDLLLFIDDIDTLAGLGAPSGALDALGILRRVLSEDGLRILAATTPELYEKHLKEDTGFRSLAVVSVEEPAPEAALEILEALRPKYETHHEVKISDEALRAAVSLSGKIPGRRFPDKAIDLMDEAAAAVRIRSLSLQTRSEDEQVLRRILREKEQAVLCEKYEAAAALHAEEVRIRTRLQKYAVLQRENGMPVVTAWDVSDIAVSWLPGIFGTGEEKQA